MKRLLILVTFLGLTAHFCDVQGSAEISQEELDRRLIEAASSGIDLAKIRDLLGAGANVNAVNRYGATALMKAAEGDHREIVELLLQEGANVNAVNNDGETALMWVVFQESKEIVELLLQAGADVNAVSNDGWPALKLALAVYKESKEIVELLLQAGADVNAVDFIGWTALMLAARNGRREAVELLLQARANVNAVNNNGQTAIDLARNQEIRDLLMLYKTLKFIPIVKQFDHEPKPEDYIVEVVIPAGTSEEEAWGMLGQDDKRLDQQIKAFEQDHIDYWRNKVQEAYKIFLANDPIPLRTLFTQEIYAKFGLLPEIISFFNSPGDFISVLKQLQQGATPEETERLQKMINVEERGESIRKEHLQRYELMREEQLRREALREALKVAVD